MKITPGRDKEPFGEKITAFFDKLHKSKRYKRAKSAVRTLLEDPTSRFKKIFDLTIIFLILSSVFILIYEVKHPIPKWMDIYDIYVVSFVFLIEYLLRLWIYNDLSDEFISEYDRSIKLGMEFRVWKTLAALSVKKLSYVIKPAAIVDMLAILPAYRPLRVLRIFVLFRFLKLLRYTRSINQFVEVLANKRFELITLLILLMFVVTTGGIAIYVLEETHNPNINTIFDALYWSLVTISTVGYGDISPVSDFGRVISMVIILFGIAMLSFATSVIVSAFSEKLNELKEERVVEEVNKNSEFYIICGYGQMTKMFFRLAKKEMKNYIILDKDSDRVAEAIQGGYKAIKDDASRHDTLERFRTANSKVTILCMSHDDVENIYITLNAKSISRDIKVIARAGSVDMIKKYERAGADHILLPNEVASRMMMSAILRPRVYEAIHGILTGDEKALLDEIDISRHSKLIGRKVKDIDFRGFRLLFIGINKGDSGEFIFNPDREVELRMGDTLLVMGHRINIEYFREMSFTENV